MSYRLFVSSRDDSLSVEESIGETLAQVGPSMLLTTSAEILCFVVGKFINFYKQSCFSIIFVKIITHVNTKIPKLQ